ncbi:hypothetical protein ACJJTC_015308 [Scirpophaga incertulas]
MIVDLVPLPALTPRSSSKVSRRMVLLFLARLMDLLTKNEVRTTITSRVALVLDLNRVMLSQLGFGYLSNNARNIIGLPLFDTSTKAVERRARFEAPADIVTTGVGPDDVILLLSFKGASIVEAKLVVACNAADNVDGCTSICVCCCVTGVELGAVENYYYSCFVCVVAYYAFFTDTTTCEPTLARQLPRRGESNEEERNDFDLLKL